jgi:hypothetical protein
MRHRGQQLPFDPVRKVRTTEHVISDLSYNFLERKVLQRGHWLDSPTNDYGIDATMFHHNERGEIENGEIRFQLKATKKVKPSRGGDWISQRVEMRDLRYWYFEFYPVVLVVFEADKDRAYWLHIQDYIEKKPSVFESEAASISLRVPTKNKLNLHAIDRFRRLSMETLAKHKA